MRGNRKELVRSIGSLTIQKKKNSAAPQREQKKREHSGSGANERWRTRGEITVAMEWQGAVRGHCKNSAHIAWEERAVSILGTRIICRRLGTGNPF